MYDIIVIGAGVSGSCIARELSRYNANICVLEKNNNVCTETSKANSGIVHSGYDSKEGTLKAKLNILGNRMMKELSKDLDFPYKNIGSFVMCTDENDVNKLYELLKRGRRSNVEGLSILSREETFKMEPNISDSVVASLYAKTAGIVCPFTLNIAMAENAFTNGVEFRFNTEVLDIVKENEYFIIETNNKVFKTKYVVNACGVYADKIHNMVSPHKIHITARKGEYLLLDSTTKGFVNSVIFGLPSKLGKGVLVAPTVHGNIIVGPTASDINDKEGVNTTIEGLKEVVEKCNNTLKNVPTEKVITSFAGLRAHGNTNDFIIGEVKGLKGFIDCAAIESPGLTSCPAIGVMVANILKDRLNLTLKNNFIKVRTGIKSIKDLSDEEFNKLIKEDKRYGNIICRCERITEGEIINAIKRPLGATTIDGIKKRTRMGFGRCQGGFCLPKSLDILSQELNCSVLDIKKDNEGSNFLTNKNSVVKKV